MPLKRLDRINEEVKKTVSDIVREMKDPRISEMTTVLSADVTNDFKNAKIRISVYADDDVRKSTVEALNHASGFIGRELGMRMDIRRIPKLNFILDNSIEYSIHISKILNDLNISAETEDDDDEAE